MIQDAMQAIVWTSVLTSALLSIFMFVQSAVDPPRRLRFAAFGATWAYLTSLDLLFPILGPERYELLRLAWCGGYAGSLIWLLEDRFRPALAAAFALSALGLSVVAGGRPELATTVAFPAGLAVAALVHFRHFRRHHGFASAVLGAYSAAMVLECSTYHAILISGDARIIALGYAHWAVMSLVCVLFGWIHLPRELRGRTPVRIETRHAAALVAAVVSAEIGVLLGCLAFFTWPPYLYLAATLAMLAATIVFYFHHRHRLVIHTDNIAALLEDRTASLRRAREELARQNDVLADRLAEQARDLRVKGEVIERQRRLELAAQTAGQAAHDIQNLVTPVLGEIFRLRRVAGNPQEVGETADRLRRHVNSLVDLNAQLLALARRGRLDIHPVHAGELMREVADRHPGGRVAVEAAAEAWILGSWAQLLRAVANLAQNALEADEAGGSPVRLRAEPATVRDQRRCHLGFLAPGDYVRITVEDRGPGIPEPIRERVFEPFFSTKDGGHRSGSGLGLSIVAAVVEDHRGVLDLRTGPGGTTFTLWLPSAPAPDSTDAAGPDAPREATVLLADDDPAVRRHYGRILEEAGYAVLTASDGFQVLSILRDEQADAVVLDLRMPRMTGIETCFGIAHLRPGSRVIVHSSYVDGDEASRLRREGVDAILEKPASRAEFLRAVRQAIEAGTPAAAPGAIVG